MVRLLAFLGNPGKNYEKTRHNFGFIVGDFFVDKKGLNNKWQNKFHGLYIKDGDNILLKPQTFMNISGQSVYEAAIFFKVKPEDVLVVHDDIELPFGKV